MSAFSAIARVYGWQLIARVLPQILAFGISVATMRVAGVDTVGMYAVSVAIVSISVGLFGAGLDAHYLRGGPRATVSLVIATKLLIWICSAPLAIFLLNVLEVPLRGGVAVYAAMFFVHIAETLSVAARLSGRDVRAVVPRVMPAAAFFIGIVIVKPSSFEGVSLLFLLSSALVVFIADVRWSAVSVSDYQNVRKLLSGAKHIVGMLFFTQVYGNTDLILVNLFLNHAAAGQYRIAQAFAAVLMPSIAVLTFVYLSKLRDVVAKGDTELLKTALVQQIWLHIALGLLVVFFMSMLLPWAIPFFYGVGAEPALVPALILSGAAALNAVGMVFVYTLLSLEMDRAVLAATAAAAFSSILLNVLFIPVLGTTGAALASVLTFLVMVVVLCVLTSRALRDFGNTNVELRNGHERL